MAESGEDQCEVTITGTEKARGRAAALVRKFLSDKSIELIVRHLSSMVAAD